MKARRLFTMLLMSVIFSFSMVAQESVIPVDSVHRLKKVEKNTLDYAKKTLNKQSNKINFPLEINALMGDTANCGQYQSIPMWEQSFFVRQLNVVSTLIVPLAQNPNNDKIQSALIVMCDNDRNFYRIVSSKIVWTENNSTTNEININSNLEGLFLNAELYSNGVKTKDIVGISQTIGVYDRVYDSSPNPKSRIQETNERLNRNFFNADSRTNWSKSMGEAVINSIWNKPQTWIITPAKQY